MNYAKEFANTGFSLRRPFLTYGKVQEAVARILRNRSWLVKKSRLRDKAYLNIGCGLNTHDHFINLDYGWNQGIDICWDITKGLPLPNASMQGVYTEHCLEHIPFEAVDRVLAEIRRVLAPGGHVRIVVPDGELYLTRYTEIIRNQSTSELPYRHEDDYQGLYSPIMSVNRIFRAHGHLFIYDYATFRLLLEKNGFVDIVKESFRSGRAPQLLIDSEMRAIESLYVEATAPSR